MLPPGSVVRLQKILAVTGEMISGHLREKAFLLAVLRMQTCVHVLSDGESLTHWQKIQLKILQPVIYYQHLLPYNGVWHKM